MCLYNVFVCLEQTSSSSGNATRESDIISSPIWDQEVAFTLKDCILYDVDKRRNNYFDYRLIQSENNLLLAQVQTENKLVQTENKLLLAQTKTEKKLLLMVVGCAVSIISSIAVSNYTNKLNANGTSLKTSEK